MSYHVVVPAYDGSNTSSAQTLTESITIPAHVTLNISGLTSFTVNEGVTITNNGKIPTDPIKEGSGLSTLRRSIESSGGEMHISHNPRFALLITIPAKEMSL